jgi:hypothetical protein
MPVKPQIPDASGCVMLPSIRAQVFCNRKYLEEGMLPRQRYGALFLYNLIPILMLLYERHLFEELRFWYV